MISFMLKRLSIFSLSFTVLLLRIGPYPDFGNIGFNPFLLFSGGEKACLVANQRFNLWSTR